MDGPTYSFLLKRDPRYCVHNHLALCALRLGLVCLGVALGWGWFKLVVLLGQVCFGLGWACFGLVCVCFGGLGLLFGLFGWGFGLG